jgi:diaminohydroxyphosphoribosylaminopyrimidine deaminase/5-amino-6-(5-phosphoribosylamino)uracil reductase
MSLDDERMMRLAVDTAVDARLRSRPNPWVGAVVVTTDGQVFCGATMQPGEAHAEVVALQAAGANSRGATLYTTLEPCSHTGKTGPCTQAIVLAKISRVVVGIIDPDKHVAGNGIQQLRDAGITVDIGIEQELIAQQLAPYLHHRRTGRPYVILKMAMTLDGRVAMPDSSQWITGESARKRVHQLRAESDAILVGAGTVRADNPSLTTRDVHGPSPRRVVLGKVSPTDKVNPCLEWNGSLPDLLDTLGSEGVIQLMVEGGPHVATSFHNERLIDQYILHLAPIIAGGGQTSNALLESADMSSMMNGHIVSTQVLDNDIEIILERNSDNTY